MNRRELLRAFLGAPAMLAAGCGGPPPRPVPGELVGASDSFGHRIRDQVPPVPSSDRWDSAEVVIVGAGIAGLSAARRLVGEGLQDFVLLELEPAAGGTSRSGGNDRTAYPWGAHYLPVPLAHDQPLIELLNEIHVLEGTDEQGHPLAAEQHLCRDPQERLFYKGRWTEGLYLYDGATRDDLDQLARFEAEIDQWVAWRDGQGRRAFTLPMAAGSRDPHVTQLDQLSMAQWLDRHEFHSSRLRWLVDYSCRDDYGMRAEQTSAWAGLFYFAARKRAPGQESQPFITWPEGNGRLVRHMKESLTGQLRLSMAAVDLAPQHSDGVESVDVVAVDRDGQAWGFHARHVIFAAPRFLAPHVIRPWRDDPPPHVAEFQYGSWMVANVAVRDRPASLGFPLCWDNVFYESPSLGYVTATHQSDLDYGPTVLTYYYPLCGDDIVEQRQRLQDMGQPEWAEVVMSDMQLAHQNMREIVERIDVMRWGHAMVRPRPGFMFGPARAAAAHPYRNVHFAHSDISGLPLFEEAFDRGLQAADNVLQEIRTKAG